MSNITDGNGTSSESSTVGIGTAVLVSVVFLVIIMVVSLVGNIVVVIIVTKKRRMQTFTNWMILNLAIADLSVALLAIPLEIPMELQQQMWIYGKTFCSLFYPMQTSSVYGSVFTLVVLSMSRFWAITKPFKKQPTIFHAKILIGVIWVCSFVVAIPYMTVLKYDEGNKTCSEVWTDNRRRTYTIAIFIFQYVLPLTIISIAYIYIVYELRYKSNCESKNSKAKRAETKKVIKLLCIITFTFAICVLPYHIVGLCMEFGNAKNFKYIYDVTIASYLLLYINSALNPIIYNVFNSKFRESYRELYQTIVMFLFHPKQSTSEIGFFSKRRVSYVPGCRSRNVDQNCNQTEDLDIEGETLITYTEEKPQFLHPNNCEAIRIGQFASN